MIYFKFEMVRSIFNAIIRNIGTVYVMNCDQITVANYDFS